MPLPTLARARIQVSLTDPGAARLGRAPEIVRQFLRVPLARPHQTDSLRLKLWWGWWMTPRHVDLLFRDQRPQSSGVHASGATPVRHVLVDTQGMLVTALVTPADGPDVDGAYALLPAAKAVAPTLQHVWVDGGYQGDWADWAAEEHAVTVEVVRRPAGMRGFVVQARRWVVERSLAWYGRNRRLSRDFELYEATSETFVYLAACRLLLRRLRPILNN